MASVGILCYEIQWNAHLGNDPIFGRPEAEMRNEIGVFPVPEEPGVQIVRRKFEFRFLTFLQSIYENAPFQTNRILLRDGRDRFKGARLRRSHLVNALIRRDCPPKHRSD